MKLNKPSYGVFMVDVFASSVGIFILISLLYIIESAKATSNEAMVDRFKTLVKRDLVPVDRYSLPIQNDPLHDWGVRARHAREKQEALILLLRDGVLLYHTNQILSVDEIVDSDIIAQYYQKYNKNRRLFLEIHYHDAYHLLKAKIHQALPDNVHQWIHWAYNAGNLENPNPVMSGAGRPNIDLSKGDQNAIIEGNEDGMPSSITNTGSGQGSSLVGKVGEGQGTATGAESDKMLGGANDGTVDSDNQGKSGDGDGDADTSSDGKPGDDQNTNADGQNIPADVKKEVAKQLNLTHNAETFAEKFLAPAGQNASANKTAQKKQQQNQDQQDQQDQQRKNNSNKSARNANERNNNPLDMPIGNSRPNPPTEQEQAKNEQQKKIQAENHIKKNVFLAVPLYSPIYQFKLDVRVPGFSQQQFNLNSVGLNLHQSSNENSPAERLKLAHGDTIVPIDNQLKPGQQTKPAGWMRVKVTKVSVQGAPVTGWLYGHVADEVFMLPLYENTVQSFETDDYWFKRNSAPLATFDVIPVKQGNP